MDFQQVILVSFQIVWRRYRFKNMICALRMSNDTIETLAFSSMSSRIGPQMPSGALINAVVLKKKVLVINITTAMGCVMMLLPPSLHDRHGFSAVVNDVGGSLGLNVIDGAAR